MAGAASGRWAVRMKFVVELAVRVGNMRRAGWQEQLLAGGQIRPSTSTKPLENKL